jgi:hypothetical protein
MFQMKNGAAESLERLMNDNSTAQRLLPGPIAPMTLSMKMSSNVLVVSFHLFDPSVDKGRVTRNSPLDGAFSDGSKGVGGQ